MDGVKGTVVGGEEATSKCAAKMNLKMVGKDKVVSISDSGQISSLLIKEKE